MNENSSTLLHHDWRGPASPSSAPLPLLAPLAPTSSSLTAASLSSIPSILNEDLIRQTLTRLAQTVKQQLLAVGLTRPLRFEIKAYREAPHFQIHRRFRYYRIQVDPTQLQAAATSPAGFTQLATTLFVHLTQRHLTPRSTLGGHAPNWTSLGAWICIPIGLLLLLFSGLGEGGVGIFVLGSSLPLGMIGQASYQDFKGYGRQDTALASFLAQHFGPDTARSLLVSAALPTQPLADQLYRLTKSQQQQEAAHLASAIGKLDA